MRADIRKAVFDSKDIPEERVNLPKAWGGAEILVRGLSAGELSDWAKLIAGLMNRVLASTVRGINFIFITFLINNYFYTDISVFF